MKENPITAVEIGALTADNLQEATNAALAQAKESGEFDGEKGEPGTDGQNIFTTTETMENETAVFLTEQVTTNGKTIKIGDLILTANGRIYRATTEEDSSIFDAELVCEVKGTNGDKGDYGGAGSINSEAVTLLITILRNAVYTSDQSTNITKLEAALTTGDGDTGVTLTGISATYDGGDVKVGTAVNDITGIVVTAH